MTAGELEMMTMDVSVGGRAARGGRELLAAGAGLGLVATVVLGHGLLEARGDDTSGAPAVAGVQADATGLHALDTYLVAGAGPGTSRADLVTTLTAGTGPADRLVGVRVGDGPLQVPARPPGVGSGITRVGPEPGALRVRLRVPPTVRAGTFVRVTLVFARHGSTVADVPVWGTLVPGDDAGAA